MPEQASLIGVTVKPGDQAQQVIAGRADVQGPQVAGQVIAQGRINGLQIQLELSFLVQFPQVGTGLAGVLGHEPRIVIIERCGYSCVKHIAAAGSVVTMRYPCRTASASSRTLCTANLRAASTAPREMAAMPDCTAGVHIHRDAVVFEDGHHGSASCTSCQFA